MIRYKAYVMTADQSVPGLSNSSISNGYTADPYDQPAKFHRAIALLDAATGDRNYCELKGVGQRQHFPIYNEVDYYVYEEFLESEEVK